jgi:hypothetical protein
MLNDQHTSYHWQDHVITPRRATLNLLATVPIVAVLGLAGFATGHDPTPVAHPPITTEQASSPAEIVKRPAPLRPRSEALKGC